MQFNHEAFKELAESKGWTVRKLATKLELDYSHVYRVLNRQRGVGLKFISQLAKLCKKEGLNFTDFLSY